MAKEFTLAAARKRVAERFKIHEETAEALLLAAQRDLNRGAKDLNFVGFYPTKTQPLGVVEKDDSVVAKSSPTPERVRPQRLVGPSWAPLQPT